MMSVTPLVSSGCDRWVAASGRRLPAGEEIATNDRPRRNEVCLVMAVNDGGIPPILAQKHYTRPTAFTPENLLREACRQEQITGSNIADICVPDPDGDILQIRPALVAIVADRLRSRLLP